MNKEIETNLLELKALLVSHDWFYMMSDDQRYYDSGKASYDLIWKLMDKLKDDGYFVEAENLYDTYKREMI